MDHSIEKNNGKSGRMRPLIALLTFLTLGGLGTTCYLAMENSNMLTDVNNGKLDKERLWGEKLSVEKQVADLHGRLDNSNEALATAEHTIVNMRQRVEEAIARARKADQVAHRNRELTRALADLREEKLQLEDRLNFVERDSRTLQDKLYQVTLDRDALANTLAERNEGARMVNNAEVDALRGRKGRLTVIARRTREIRMAFDLPNGLAQGTTFKIITPDGRTFEGADPSISSTVDEPQAEPMASTDPTPTPVTGDRAARVHLRFAPQEKLKPGAYRIDVSSGGEYLNTVLLNLR